MEPQQYEQGAAHTVLGQVTQNYVSYVMQNQDMTGDDGVVQRGHLCRLPRPRHVAEDGLLQLAVRPVVVFPIAPAPGGTGGGSGSKAHDTHLRPSTSAGPHYVLGIRGIAQPRPAV